MAHILQFLHQGLGFVGFRVEFSREADPFQLFLSQAKMEPLRAPFEGSESLEVFLPSRVYQTTSLRVQGPKQWGFRAQIP